MNETRNLTELEMLKLDLLNEIKSRKRLEKITVDEQIQRRKVEIDLIIQNFNTNNNNDPKLKELEDWFNKLKLELDIKDGFSLDRSTGEIRNPDKTINE